MDVKKCTNCKKCFFDSTNEVKNCPHCKVEIVENPFYNTGHGDIFNTIFGKNE